MRSKTSLTAAIGATLFAVVAIAEFRTLGTSSNAYATAKSAYTVGNFARAERLFAHVARKHPENVEALQGLAMARLQSGNIDAARRNIAALIAIESGNTCHLALRGIMHDIAGEYRNAVADYTTAAQGCAAATHGATWWQRMTLDLHAQTPAIAKRLAYLRRELSRPLAERRIFPPRLRARQSRFVQSV
ncbi:MAG: tetratricopeptide repeat protein [Pseudomonadota bacterium]